MSAADLPRDYLPVPVSVVDAGEPRQLFVVRPSIAVRPGSDVEIKLDRYLPRRPSARVAQLLTLVVGYSRDARSVYVSGGQLDVREQVATMIATAYAPAIIVLWDDGTPGVKHAPRFRVTTRVLSDESGAGNNLPLRDYG